MPTASSSRARTTGSPSRRSASCSRPRACPTADRNGARLKCQDGGMRSCAAILVLLCGSAAAGAESMSREGSGTSWLPDASPIYADMQMFGEDMLMLHGVAFPRYTHVGGDRDVSEIGRAHV